MFGKPKGLKIETSLKKEESSFKENMNIETELKEEELKSREETGEGKNWGNVLENGIKLYFCV